MTTIKAFIKRHPALTYFVLTLAISTGGILIAVGREGMPIDRYSLIPILSLFAGKLFDSFFASATRAR